MKLGSVVVFIHVRVKVMLSKRLYRSSKFAFHRNVNYTLKTDLSL